MATKNAFATELRKIKENAYSDGLWSGMRVGLNIVAIALNHEFGFGEARLKRLEQKVQTLVDEIVDTNDPEVTEEHVIRAIKQIRGEAWEG